MSKPKGGYYLETFGCQMNRYDSEKIDTILANSGMVRADSPAHADLIVLNTCSIRDKAEQKVFSRIGRLARYKGENKNLVIALGGCMATLRKEEIFRRAPVLDIAFGPDSLSRLPELVEESRSGKKRRMAVEFSNDGFGKRPAPAARPSKISAWVAIMKGCDNHCSYCVVPATRGPEVSRPSSPILAEVTELAENGYKEINLLGQNVNSYGKKLHPKIDFPRLLRMVAEVEGIRRIRFMTSHPKDLTDDLIEVMATTEKVCPSIHLPLQAGSNRILRMMNRGYTSAQYLERLERLKKALPDITVSTDIMVGFPTETEEEFRETLNVMETARYDSIYLFNYSKRPGTPSAEYEGALTRKVSQSRFERALRLNREIIAKNNRNLVGRKFGVLCEGSYNGGRDNPHGRWLGRTPGNHLVLFGSDKNYTGETAPVTITGVMGYNLKGEADGQRQQS